MRVRPRCERYHFALDLLRHHIVLVSDRAGGLARFRLIRLLTDRLVASQSHKLVLMVVKFSGDAIQICLLCLEFAHTFQLRLVI